MASLVEMRRMRRVRRFNGYGATDVENIVCPAGTTVNGDAAGNVWCQDATGAHVAATFTPAAPAQVVGAPQQAGMGVVGWGILIAGGLALASVLMKGRGR